MALESQTILVVGGGIAGITAATEAAETGYEVILLEKEPSLGGRVSRFNRYFPKLCHPACGLEINYQRIRKNPRLRVMTMCAVVGISGEKGNYTVNVRRAPRHVNQKCTACGDCAKASEMEIPNAFNYGLDNIKAAYLPHEHAYPMRYVIAPEAAAGEEGKKMAAACVEAGLCFATASQSRNAHWTDASRTPPRFGVSVSLRLCLTQLQLYL